MIYLPPIQVEQPTDASTSPYRPRVPLRGQKSKINVSLVKQANSIHNSDGLMLEQDDVDSENNFNLEVKAIM